MGSSKKIPVERAQTQMKGENKKWEEKNGEMKEKIHWIKNNIQEPER